MLLTKKLNSILFGTCLLTGLLFFSACKKERSINENEDPDPNALIDPADANALAAVIIIPDGQTVEGSPPPPSSSPDAPTVTNNIQSVISSNGSTTPLDLNFETLAADLGGCYILIDGADSFIQVPYPGGSTSSGTLGIPISIPTNVDEGQFCVSYCVYDVNGLVSNIVNSCVNVLRLGTGAMQISLSWNTPTDQDLWVTEPDGNKIYYGNSTSYSGGQLDRDDTDGYGPENIYWVDTAPDGNYIIEVDDYEYSSSPNTCYVTVNTSTDSRQYSIITEGGGSTPVVTVIKSGDNYTFQ